MASKHADYTDLSPPCEGGGELQELLSGGAEYTGCVCA